MKNRIVSNLLKRKDRTYYLFIVFILVLGFVFRVYRIDKLLGFYYDQGRDALVVWDFIHKGRFFLIGPTTGIEGVFRGPWYYWLITPFYWLGKGNPVYPSVFLSLTTVIAVYLLFLMAKEIGGKIGGLTAVIIGSISFYFVTSSRWLSNPTPMYLISMLFVWSLFKIIDRKKWAWVLAMFMAGMAMQFGSAAEVFYIPFLIIFALLNRDKIASFKLMLLGFLSFVSAFLPQIIFDIRHHGVLLSAIRKFLFEEGSFKLSFWQMVKLRTSFYLDTFSSLIWSDKDIIVWVVLGITLLMAFVKWREILKNRKIQALLILLFSPLIGMFFFQGNEGNVYGYYFTGYFFIFVLIFSYLISLFSRYKLGRILVFLFLLLFLNRNITRVKGYINSGVDGESAIALGNQIQAIDWIIKDADGREFNVDVYVPPVIPYAYDYLFLWQTSKKCGENMCGLIKDRRVDNLYTLYEIDPPHPERLDAWLERQKGIGFIEKEKVFGGITIQKRKRLGVD